QGIVPTGDTLHVFVNHWPSRLGGELESEHKRLYVASVLKDKIEEINKTTHNPKIVIMGDFNDSPENKSLKVILGAENPQDSLFLPKNLYNLSYPFHDKGDIGTHKRLGEWAVLDQIIVSGTLLDDKNRFYTTKQNIYIYTPWFLKEPDEKNIGFKPFRMYQGFKYNGGISDHFPVFVKFFMQMDLE
ncbi:endonuclease, partial [Bacteroidales bacterium OttesenSCG-928-I21]|nr:endonuclease [Bacteroidales bacterium OttesenSCG-928-I21]